MNPDDDKNRELFKKMRVLSIDIHNNYNKIVYHHEPPQIEFPNFRFILPKIDKNISNYGNERQPMVLNPHNSIQSQNEINHQNWNIKQQNHSLNFQNQIETSNQISNMPIPQLNQDTIEEFTVNNLEYDFKLTYDIKTNIQTLTQRKIRHNSYLEFHEFFNDQTIHIKNFIHALFVAVETLNKQTMRIQLTYLTYQKAIMVINNNIQVTFIMTFSKSEIVKILIHPGIGTLNIVLAQKFHKAVHLESFQSIVDHFTFYLNEFLLSYEPFRIIYDLQYTNDSLRKGPHHDNNSFIFEFSQTQFNNQYDQIMQTSVETQSQSENIELKKELIMIVAFRKIYQVGFKVDKFKKTLVIVDYIKQCYMYFDEKVVLLYIPHGQSLVKCLDELMQRKIDPNVLIVFSERYVLQQDEHSEFIYEIPTGNPDLVKFVVSTVFDFLSCTYLMMKVKSIMKHCHKDKQEITTNLDAKFQIHPEPKFMGTFQTVVQNYQFKLKLMLESQKQVINQIVEKYFQEKLERCFYNYKALKGMVGILLTKVFSHTYIYELMYFELNPSTRQPFLTKHSLQEELDVMMLHKKLDIEIALEAVDYQTGKEFVITFIDKRTSRYKHVKFIESTPDQTYNPENFKNPKYLQYIQNPQQSNKKFLQRIVFLMTLDIDELK
eukprot:403345353